MPAIHGPRFVRRRRGYGTVVACRCSSLSSLRQRRYASRDLDRCAAIGESVGREMGVWFQLCFLVTWGHEFITRVSRRQQRAEHAPERAKACSCASISACCVARVEPPPDWCVRRSAERTRRDVSFTSREAANRAILANVEQGKIDKMPGFHTPDKPNSPRLHHTMLSIFEYLSGSVVSSESCLSVRVPTCVTC
jgi:hypothetical protein